MPPNAGRRALSTLIRKLHPQLPLTAHESQQLLNLLTTSFRAHLDCEHPVHAAEKALQPTIRKVAVRDDYHSPHATSSAALASRHLDAVLSNPLFTVKPSRQGTESAASHILRDPASWFLNEIATGTATLSKASLYLEILNSRTVSQAPQLYGGKTSGAIIAEWLRSSGLDRTDEFFEMSVVTPHVRRPNLFISRLIATLMNDGERRLLWKWFSRPWQSGSSPSQVHLFKKQLLKHMVQNESSRGLRQGLLVFSRAQDIVEKHDQQYERLRPAGQYLVQAIMSQSTSAVSHDLYQSFQQSTRIWLPSNWARAVDSMLWLHHPTGASASPGLELIQDSAGASTYANATKSRRHFIVQLSLGIACQLLEEERYHDAQAVMTFCRQHFPDLVMSSLPSKEQAVADRQSIKIERARREEEKNLELIDSLVPA